MAFKTLHTIELDSTFNHPLVVEILQLKNDVFVNLRTFSRVGDIKYPTFNGICLHANEFDSIVPMLMKRENFTIGSRRVVTFNRLDNPEYFLLELLKPNGNVQRLELTDDEIRLLLQNKEKILSFCSFDTIN